MRQEFPYKKGDHIWVQEYSWTGSGQIRPATILSIITNPEVFNNEPHVTVRYEDDTNPSNNYECIPLSRIKGLQKE